MVKFLIGSALKIPALFNSLTAVAAGDSDEELPDIPDLVVAPNPSGVEGDREQRDRERRWELELRVRQQLHADNPAEDQGEYELVEGERLEQLSARLPEEQSRHAALLPPEPPVDQSIEVRFNFRLRDGGAANFVRRFPPETPGALLRTAVLAHPLAPNNSLVRVLEGFPPTEVAAERTLREIVGGQRRVAVTVRQVGQY